MTVASNSADVYPEDATKHEAGVFASSSGIILGLAVLVVFVVLLMRVGRRRGPSLDIGSVPAAPQLPEVVAPTGPPLPPEGLPAG